ncbi:PRC-barrel domain containing protein [Bradyrhizobium sp. Ash2021]|uniref:PRC-barrel domain containing protein n=1 Tax=Bradyrhizobium sp. Ash2021 TaxID=2954771 RepID=UPI002815CEC8|nr:PRC-barrel domain containing protein [Bradyrhizobium sp. Ash2021]WMT78761.1 PRC-barrel domain containing protein [Bradyrhizobium sp. Ash2021]
MPVKTYALTILRAFEDAQADLVGKAVVLTDGKAGTVEKIWLDEAHGLRISIKGHNGKWPVSTIKFAQKSDAV